MSPLPIPPRRALRTTDAARYLGISPSLLRLSLIHILDAKELIAQAGEGEALPQKAPRAARILDSSKLADVFGIDLPAVDLKSPAKPRSKPVSYTHLATISSSGTRVPVEDSSAIGVSVQVTSVSRIEGRQR